MGSSIMVMLVLLGLHLELVAAQTGTSFNFNSFDCSGLMISTLKCLGDSSTNGPGQLNLTAARTTSVGHAVYAPAIRFLDPTTSKTSSFSTNFTFSIQAVDYASQTAGEGLAFVLSADPAFTGSGGGFLGVYGPDGVKAPTLTIEFDTFKNVKAENVIFNDINDNHVGLDVESINSKIQVDAESSGVILSKASTVTAWVDYSASTDVQRLGTLQVRISGSNVRPTSPLLSYDIDLSKIFTEYVYVGFSASTGDQCASYHNILCWGFSSWGIPPYSQSPAPQPITCGYDYPCAPHITPAPNPSAPASNPSPVCDGYTCVSPNVTAPPPPPPPPPPPKVTAPPPIDKCAYGSPCPAPPGGGKNHPPHWIYGPICGGIALLAAFCLCFACCRHRHRHHEEEEVVGCLALLVGACLALVCYEKWKHHPHEEPCEPSQTV